MAKYGINKVILVGNVGTDPELRHLEDGTAVCSFRFATTVRYKTREGLPSEHTEWHNIVLWRQQAEFAKQYFHVGDCLYLEGSLATRSWDGPDGHKRFRTEIEVDEFRMLDSARNDQDDSESGASTHPKKSPISDEMDIKPF
jgi:single-strand DNA-binding protein